MTPREYILAVNRWLNLPPWYRLRELNQVAGAFCAGKSDGLSPEEVEASLGSPGEAARRILSGYPQYRKSSFRYIPLLAACAGLWQLLCAVIILRNEFYRHVTLPAEIAAASPGLTPAEYIGRCLLAVVLGLSLYIRLKYVRT